MHFTVIFMKFLPALQQSVDCGARASDLNKSILLLETLLEAFIFLSMI